MSIIAAGTTTTTALRSTGNTDGTLQLQVNGSTPSVTLNTLGAIGVGSTPAYGSAGQVLTSNGSTSSAYWATPSAGGSAATPTVLGTLYGKMDAGYPNNAGVGYNALLNNTATNNAALGVGALQATVSGGGNVAVGYAALNANTSYANVAVGSEALKANTGGNLNVAIGANALLANTSGDSNTAVGYDSLKTNTTGTYNIAVGREALKNNTAANNVAVGGVALVANTTGTSNVAIGHLSYFQNTTGNNNTGIGYGSGASNSTASGTTAVGRDALASNTTSNYGTAFGHNSLYSCTTGNINTACGYQAGYSVTTGISNIFVGRAAGILATTGSYNAVLGWQRDGSDSDIEVFALRTESNRVLVGASTTTNAYVKVAWTVTSDARDKTNISPITLGLDFVNQLNPVSYQFKVSRTNNTPSGNKRYGFLAQDILALEGNDPVIIDNEKPDNLKYQGESLVPVLVKAIQELTARIAVLEGK